jgi:hypothetical protein
MKATGGVASHLGENSSRAQKERAAEQEMEAFEMRLSEATDRHLNEMIEDEKRSRRKRTWLPAASAATAGGGGSCCKASCV